ncbi:MAG TPA: hypothetical protein EYN13_07145 [Methylococcales bacterium]|nr:hypothetical protein [Methylococcales bacterium]
MDCKYHPDTKASWHCNGCDVAFCIDCVPEDARSSTPKCSLCRRYLTPMGISESITPFWFKLGHFFAYPFAPPLLIVATAFSLLFAYFFNPDNISLMAIPFWLIATGFITKVFFSIMEYTAYGNLDSPNWKKMMSTDNGWMFLKLLAMMVILIVVIYKLASVSMILSVGVAVFFFLAYPAMNIILCMDKSMWSALNPARILYVMSAIGGGYWILFGLIIMFGLSMSFGMSFLAGYIDQSVAVPLSQFFSLYLSFAMYHMFGYVIYQYHFELDFSVHRQNLYKNIRAHGKHTSEVMDDTAKAVKSSGLTEAEIFIQEGRYEEAEASLIDALKQDDSDNQVYELLYKLFALQGNISYMVKLCEKHLKKLSESRSSNLMRIHYLNTLQHQADYCPKDPKVAHQLIKALNRKEDAKPALQLLNHLKKHHIDYDGLADACFTFAKMLTEKLNKRQEAAKIIRWGMNVANEQQKEAMGNYLRLLV